MCGRKALLSSEFVAIFYLSLRTLVKYISMPSLRLGLVVISPINDNCSVGGIALSALVRSPQVFRNMFSIRSHFEGALAVTHYLCIKQTWSG